TTTTYAAYRIAPKTQTTYWFASDASDTYEPSGADTVTVKVCTGVDGRVLDRTIKVGQRAAIKGHIMPLTRGVKVSLQRKVGGRWATVATGRTASRGEVIIV